MKLFSRIFSMLFLALAFSVLFCAPTFAEETLSISVDGVAEVEATPNTLETGTVDVYVSSSSRDGYKLSISDSDNENALVSGQGNAINPLLESVTADNFTTNAWGVKVGNNFLPVPKLSDNVLELANTSAAATNEKHTVTFGMKVDGTTVSGDYSSEVVFTAVANPLVIRKATLEAGTTVNAAWKTLANNSSTTYTTVDDKITSVQKFTGDFTDALRSAAQDIATTDSDWPVYTWFDNGTIYYYTEADEVFFNANSSYMFSNMRSLTGIDFNFGKEADIDPDGDGIIAGVQGPVYITSNVTNMGYMFNYTTALTTLDVSDWDTSKVTNMSYMFANSSSLTTLDVSDWNTSKVTNMSYMFRYASSLTALDVTNWDTSSVSAFGYMFYEARALVTLNVSNWDTSKATSMSSMFYETRSLTALDVSNWNTSRVTSMSYAFYGTMSLGALDVSRWDTSSVTSMYAMFTNARSLAALDVSHWNTSNVTRMDNMFSQTHSLATLDVSNWDTSKVTAMNSMFLQARALVTLDVSKWNTSNVTGMENMFNGASSLTTLNVSDWDTSSVTSMYAMFSKTSSLTTLDVSDWDTSKVTNMSYMFANSSSLTTLDVSDWNTSKVTDMSYMFNMFDNNGSLVTLDVSDWDTSSVTKMDGMFSGNVALTTLDVSKWNTGSVTNMSRMFYYVSALTTLDISSWNTSNVTSMESMFSYTSALTTIYASDRFDTNAVTNSTNMFYGASRLVGGNGTVYNYAHTDKEYARIDRPGTPGYFSEKRAVRKATLKTGQQVNAIWKSFTKGDVVNYTSTDQVITSIQKFTGDFTDSIQSSAMDIATSDSDWPVYTWLEFATGTIYYYTEADEVFFNANSSYMFYNMQKLVSVDFNFGVETDVDPDGDGYIASVQDPVYITSSVTKTTSMFSGASSLTSLDVSRWDTSKVTSMGYMFSETSSLTSLDVSNWDTSSVTDMQGMFNNALALTSLDVSNWDTSSVTDMSGMFRNTSSLASLDVSNWDTSSVTRMDSMFAGTSSLTTIYASDKFNTSAVKNSAIMFYDASSLVGGNGTVYNARHVDKEYARIDTATTPGYFTAKPAGN